MWRNNNDNPNPITLITNCSRDNSLSIINESSCWFCTKTRWFNIRHTLFNINQFQKGISLWNLANCWYRYGVMWSEQAQQRTLPFSLATFKLLRLMNDFLFIVLAALGHKSFPFELTRLLVQSMIDQTVWPGSSAICPEMILPAYKDYLLLLHLPF